MPVYVPKVMDTSSVELPTSLQDLLERLAENTHEVWAEARHAEGWTYGPKRSDARKKHPGLVPYAKLSEAEKEYDRKTATQALKVILKLGYTIGEPPPPPGRRRKK